MVREDALVDLAAERADEGRAGQILLAGQVNHEMNTSNGRNPAVLLQSYPQRPDSHRGAPEPPAGRARSPFRPGCERYCPVLAGR
jgi:hypothetical protein